MHHTNEQPTINQRTNEKVPHVPNVPTFQRSNSSTLTDRPTKRTNERTNERPNERTNEPPNERPNTGFHTGFYVFRLVQWQWAVGGGQWAVGSLLSVAIADEGLH